MMNMVREGENYRSFVRSFVRLMIRSFVRLMISSFVRSFVCCPGVKIMIMGGKKGMTRGRRSKNEEWAEEKLLLQIGV
jgi:hypothetical protein